MKSIKSMAVSNAHIVFVRMRGVLSTLDTIDVLCIVYANEIIFE